MNLNPLQRRLTDPTVERLANAIECIRTFDEDHGSSELPIQVLTILLYVGAHNECHKQALEEDLPGMTRASVSRNTDWLSKQHRLILPSGKRRPGLGLIKKEVDPTDRRRSVLTLTKRGEELLTQIKDILYG
tara:strand:- start:109 stop:504 length:396 start_codon:yes stop_codon:yes gene_type:complete